jgi:hypothetical protein
MSYTLPIGLNLESWEEWVSYRKAMRKPLSDHAIKRWTKKFSLMPMDTQRAIIEHSMDNDYQGLFPDKFAGKLVVRESPVSGHRSGHSKDGSLINRLTDRSWAKGIVDGC